MSKFNKILTLVLTISMTLLMACEGNKSQGQGETDQATMNGETERQAPSAEASEEEGPSLNIAGIAAENENFSTLATAIKNADLISVLESEGPYTVFAPTNEAFAKIPSETLDNLLLPESTEPLAQILKYHVIAGEYMASDVVAAIESHDGEFTLETVQGNELTATLDGNSVVLTDVTGSKATVIMTDVKATNGVIHAIDHVVMPK